MKKAVKIAVWVLFIAYFFVITSFVSKKHSSVICNTIEVIIADSSSHKFIENKDVIQLLEKEGITALGEKLNSINTNKVEKILLKNDLIESCTAYKTVDGKLNIEVYQKTPITKLFTKNTGVVYLDSRGDLFRTSSKYSPHILVLSGNISIPFSLQRHNNIFDKNIRKKAAELQLLFDFATFVNANAFWEAQIEQVYRNKKGEYEIVPRVGPHLITLGELDNFHEKLWKLKILYEEGFSHGGWNNYLNINLKYNDQIVCTKI